MPFQKELALAGGLSWLEHRLLDQKAAGPIVPSHIDVSPSSSLPASPSKMKGNISRVRIKNSRKPRFLRSAHPMECAAMKTRNAYSLDNMDGVPSRYTPFSSPPDAPQALPVSIPPAASGSAFSHPSLVLLVRDATVTLLSE